MAQPTNDWGGDTSPSLPEALHRSRCIDMGGFVFTDGGIAHDLCQAEVERLRIPPFAPPEFLRQTP